MALTDPVPSQSIDVFKRNMEDSDRFVNQTSGTVTNRTGKTMRPLPVISDDIEQQITDLTADINAAKADLYPIVKFRFLVDTYEITNRNELGDTAAGETYRYVGATLPFSVTPVINPVGNPDFAQVIQTDHNNLTNKNAIGAHDAIYRRATTVDAFKSGVFSVGDRLEFTDRANAPFDVKAAGWPQAVNDYDVISDSNGNVAVLDPSLSRVNVMWCGAKGDGVANDKPPFDAAIAIGKPIIVPTPAEHYRYVGQMLLNGSTLLADGRAPEYYGTATTNTVQIVFEGVAAGQDAILQQGTLSTVKGIWFRAKDWSVQFHGLRMERAIYAEDCMFTEFNGHGQYAHSTGVAPNQPYYSVFNRCSFLLNAYHGAAVFNGANAITYRDCKGMWNGSPSYGVAPSVAGVWDGLYLDGKSPSFPAGGTAFEPQGIVVTGGDWSYNARYGQNWQRVFDSVLTGGYIENNLVGDIRFGQMYGCQVLNPLCQQAPVFEVVRQDPDTPSMNLATYPNFIWIRGIFYGNGEKTAGSDSHGYRQRLPAFYTTGTEAELEIFPKANGGLSVDSGGVQDVTFGNTVALQVPRWRLGGTNNTALADNYMIAPASAENSPYCYLISDGQFGEIRKADGGGANPAGAFLIAPKNSATNRSINAGGTVNATGADYAEYLFKSEGCGEVPKGAIVGINVDGELTDKWDESISFVIKSTDPAYVGNDTWSKDIKAPDPLQDKPTRGGYETDEEYYEAITSYNQTLEQYQLDLVTFNGKLEEARAKVDRVAFAGQVPCNVFGANVGDYIIPSTTNDGGITGIAVKSPSFEQYKLAVGKVWKILDDGRAWIAVKIS